MKTKGDPKQYEKHINPPKGQPRPNLFYSLLVLFVILFIIGILALDQTRRSLDAADSPSPMQFYTTALFSLFVLTAVVVQIIVNFLQWQAMRDQVRSSEKSLSQSERMFYLGERAYVGISSADLTEPLQAGKRPSVDFGIKNGGKTPAFAVKGIVNIVLTEQTDLLEIEKDFAEIERDNYGQYLLPGDTYLGSIIGKAPVAAKLFAEFQNKEVDLYVRIHLWFFDIQATVEREITFWYKFDRDRAKLRLCKTQHEATID